MDTNQNFRAVEPFVYGFIDRSRESGVMIAMFLFVLGYMCSKLLAVALLSSVPGGWLVVFLTCECVTFLGVRMALQNWRIYMPVGDVTWVSLVGAIGVYIVLIAAPFPVFRAPFLVSPILYAGFIMWTILCSNPLMLLLAYSFGEPKIESHLTVLMLTSTSAACVIGAALTFASMNPDYMTR